MRLHQCLGLVASVALWGGCGQKDRPGPYQVPIPNPEVPHERLPEQSDAFVEAPCPVQVPGHVVQCGWVTVPEGPGSEREIEIFVARVFSNEELVKPDPVVYLDGGPGSESVGFADAYYQTFGRAAPDRDVIFIDQRGVGESLPALVCPDRGNDSFEAARNCFERLSQDWDLNQFNTANNATDVDLVRQAFGYDKVNLWGISYGTRLGLTLLRDHPEGVRSIVLDGVVPLEADLLGEVGLNGFHAFEQVVEACDADEDCALAYPDPLGQLVGVVDRLNDEPVEVAGWPISGDTVLNVVFQALYSPAAVVFIPLMIDELAGEDYSLFEAVGEAVSSGGIASGMHFSVQCAEEVPFSSAEQYAAFDAQVPEALRVGLSGAYYLDICEYWPVDPAPPSENLPVVSDVPALVMAGRFDPITPAKYSEQVHEVLLDSQYYLLEGESHGASASSCGARVVRKFFDQPEQDAALPCLSVTPDLDFQSLRQKSQRSVVVSGDLDMRTTPPSDAELQEMLDDIRRRMRHR